MAAGADTRVKEFADAYYKNKEDVAKGVALKDIALKGIVSESIVLKGVLYRKNKKGEQKRKEVIASLVKIKLRQL
jgi:predicted metalloprotease